MTRRRYGPAEALAVLALAPRLTEGTRPGVTERTRAFYAALGYQLEDVKLPIGPGRSA